MNNHVVIQCHHVVIKARPSLPTQRSIAQAVGVSRETVSQILNGTEAHRYNEETRQKVLKTAEKLGYRPHRAAQMMRKGRSNLIGVIHFGLSYEVGRQRSKFMPPAIQERGYDTLTIDLTWQGSDNKRAVEQLIDARVEGVIITQAVASFTQNEIANFTRAGIPVVAVAGDLRWDVPVIYSDMQHGMESMTEHLIRQGHKKLLLLVSNSDASGPRFRVGGFTQGVEKAGGKISRVRDLQKWLKACGKNGVSGRIETIRDVDKPAYRFAQSMIRLGELPDVVICTNDIWARWVFSAMLENGISVPEDVAITGADNEGFGAYPPYNFTTLAQPCAAQCTQAVEWLVDLIQGRPLSQNRSAHPCELVVRKSCGSHLNPNPDQVFSAHSA